MNSARRTIPWRPRGRHAGQWPADGRARHPAFDTEEPDPDAPEVQLRVGVRARDKAPVERFTREIAPLVLTGPPSVTGFAGGRPDVQEVVAYWPALIARTEIEPHVRVEVLDA